MSCKIVRVILKFTFFLFEFNKDLLIIFRQNKEEHRQMDLFLIFISAALISNVVLMQFLGVCPFFGVSKQIGPAVGMGLAVAFVMALGSAITWLFYNFVLAPFGIQYLQTIVFVLILASIVQFIEMYLKKMFKSLYDALGIFLPLMTTNCAILGITLINVRSNHTFIEAMINSVGAGAGFLLAIVLIAIVRDKYENHPDVSKIFHGFPLALFATGLMSLAFMGFSDII